MPLEIGESDPVMDPGSVMTTPVDAGSSEPVDAEDYGFGNGGEGTAPETQEGDDPTSARPAVGSQPDASQQSVRDPYLARAAQQYGISETDYPDDASLRKAVDWASAYHQRQQQAYQQYYAQQQPQQRQLPQQLPMPQQWQNPLAGLEDIDPRFVKAYDQIAQHFNHTLAYALQQMNGTYGQLHQQFTQFQTQAQQRAEKEIWSKADSAITALGEQYEQFVGKGNVKGNARDPRYDTVRQRLVEVAAFDARRHGLEVADMDSADWKHFMKRAADFEFADHIKAQARADIGQQLKARESMVHPRQNSTVHREPPKRDEAGKFVADLMASRN